MLALVMFALSQSVLLTNAQTVAVSVPFTAPSSAAPLDQGLISFSIEQDRWTDWAGTDSPNSFFLNTLTNLGERTGQPPWIRIGADSEDHTDFSNDVEVYNHLFRFFYVDSCSRSFLILRIVLGSDIPRSIIICTIPRSF